MNETIKKVLDKTTDFSGSKSRKVTKGILGVVIVMLLGALGLEMSNTDFDLGKLMNGASMQESKVLRDKQGNVVPAGTANAKATDEYNCADFSTQPEAQKFYNNAGGVKGDINQLDKNKDGTPCVALPAK